MRLTRQEQRVLWVLLALLFGGLAGRTGLRKLESNPETFRAQTTENLSHHDLP